MDNLNPRFLLMGWMFAKNASWPQSNNKQLDNFSNYLTDLNGVLLKTSEGLYLIPKTEA